MSKEGSGPVPDPHRGLKTEDDFKRLCYRVQNEELNTFLSLHATTDPDDHTNLKLVWTVDNKRRSENDYVCYWHPSIEAIRLEGRFHSPGMGDEESLAISRFRETFRRLKNFRGLARSRVKLQRAHAELLPEDKEMYERQQEWERARMEDEC